MLLFRMLLLLAVVLPSAAMAAPCCDEPPASECCGPEGDCPTTPSGECVLVTPAQPVVSALSQALDLPMSTRLAAEQLTSAVWSDSPILAKDVGRSTPLYLALGNQRN